jgi:hypothetical protein
MTKKSTKERACETSSPRRVRRRIPKNLNGVPVSSREVQVVPSQACGTDEEALNLLLGRITDKLGQRGSEQAQMHEFLTLILDTDPSLKEELLREIVIRK